jgi:hypothetical protein
VSSELLPHETYLTERDVERTGIAKLETIRKWRALGRGPRFIKIEGRVKYRLSDVLEYLNSRPSGGRAITKPRDQAEGAQPTAEVTR